MQKNKQQETEIVEINPFAKQKNIQIIEDKDKNMVFLKIYGVIEEPDEYIDELVKLDAMSREYDVIEITLNSPGGSLNTTVDIASIIKNFSYIVTIGKGEVASAAFMLWTMGNIRVVSDYSMYMAHRESYGMYGKTTEHRDAARIFGSVYEDLFETCFKNLLTDIEKNIAERSEAWISYKDLLQRERVISLQNYINPQNPYFTLDLFVTTKDEKMFIYDKDSRVYRAIELQYTGESITDISGFAYGIVSLVKDEYMENESTEEYDNNPESQQITTIVPALISNEQENVKSKIKKSKKTKKGE